MIATRTVYLYEVIIIGERQYDPGKPDLPTSIPAQPRTIGTFIPGAEGIVEVSALAERLHRERYPAFTEDLRVIAVKLVSYGLMNPEVAA